MENQKKLTAVEWLAEALELDTRFNGIMNDVIQQAKEMEKQQIIDACLAGEDNTNTDTYYYEAFGKTLPICLNCKFAGEPFDLGGIAHVYCKHPTAIEKVDCGEFEPLDTLREGGWLCGVHEFTHSRTPDQ